MTQQRADAGKSGGMRSRQAGEFGAVLVSNLATHIENVEMIEGHVRRADKWRIRLLLPQAAVCHSSAHDQVWSSIVVSGPAVLTQLQPFDEAIAAPRSGRLFISER